MQSLERRIAELEKAGSTNEGTTTIVVRFMSPENLDGEIQELQNSNGLQHWKRQPGETEQVLIDRATLEVRRNGPGCILLMAGA